MITINQACDNVEYLHDQQKSYNKTKDKEVFVQKVFDHISDTTELTIEEVKDILER
jgi:hypothetical protein